MKKLDAKEWVLSIETILDNKLGKWLKQTKIENGEAVQLHWQFEQTNLVIDVFWQDGKEFVNLQYKSPRVSHSYQWSGLNDQTFNRVMDRVGNLAQVTMYPPIEPTD